MTDAIKDKQEPEQATPGYDHNNEVHRALACLRDFVHSADGFNSNFDARRAVDLLIKKAGMR